MASWVLWGAAQAHHGSCPANLLAIRGSYLAASLQSALMAQQQHQVVALAAAAAACALMGAVWRRALVAAQVFAMVAALEQLVPVVQPQPQQVQQQQQDSSSSSTGSSRRQVVWGCGPPRGLLCGTVACCCMSSTPAICTSGQPVCTMARRLSSCPMDLGWGLWKGETTRGLGRRRRGRQAWQEGLAAGGSREGEWVVAASRGSRVQVLGSWEDVQAVVRMREATREVYRVLWIVSSSSSSSISDGGILVRSCSRLWMRRRGCRCRGLY